MVNFILCVLYHSKIETDQRPNYKKKLTKLWKRGTWMAQSIEHPTSVQVMISQFVNLSPHQTCCCQPVSTEPTSGPLSPPFGPSPACALPKINILKNKIFKNKTIRRES